MRLLILKCSSRKRGTSDPLPAVERYDGPLWQVLRAHLRENPLWASDLDVYGLSAEFGLIAGVETIPVYDRTMSPERAEELRPEVERRFRDLMTRGYESVCLGISDRYVAAIQGWEQWVPAGTPVTVTDGGVGMKLGQLRAWLRSEPVDRVDRRPQRLAAPCRPRGRATLKGITLAMPRDVVMGRARQALAAGVDGANHYRDWYVLVDGRPVSSKWLVSLISGLPTSEFDAVGARRVLLALGVDVERVRAGEGKGEGQRQDTPTTGPPSA
jgi:hypothetical protein